MLAKVATRQDDVGDPPADRDRGEDRAQREEREAVALVDAGRDHEEGERQDGQPDEQRQAVRAARDDDRMTAIDASSRAVPTTTAGSGPNTRDARRRSRSAVPGVVAHPQPGVGQALADVAGTSAHGL